MTLCAAGSPSPSERRGSRCLGRFGIAQSRHRRQYERWLKEFVSVARVLEVNEETAIWYAEVRIQLKEAGTPIPSNDAWIAALCRQHALPILSQDQHFDLIKGLRDRKSTRLNSSH